MAIINTGGGLLNYVIFFDLPYYFL